MFAAPPRINSPAATVKLPSRRFSNTFQTVNVKLADQRRLFRDYALNGLLRRAPGFALLRRVRSLAAAENEQHDSETDALQNESLDLFSH